VTEQWAPDSPEKREEDCRRNFSQNSGERRCRRAYPCGRQGTHRADSARPLLDWAILRREAKYMIGEEFIHGLPGRHRCQPLRGRDTRRTITLLIGRSAPVVMGGPLLI
jgi:hypothetical protein